MSDGSDLTRLGAAELAALSRAGTITAEEIVDAFLARIAGRDEDVQAWAWVDPDAARAMARSLDAGEARGPLFGVPIGVKDVFQTKDMPTEHGSPIYSGHRPGIDAACVDTLRAAGAVILGKTTPVEFAGFGRKAPTRHPLDPARSPGGTSSGSAAAVGDFQIPLALGTQTAGSTIRPASFCGVHAFKPSWGLVSREGVKFFAVSLDTVTWFGRSIDDLDLLCDVFGIVDAATWDDRPIEAMTIGVCRTPYWESAKPWVKDGFEKTVRSLQAAGATLVDVDLPDHFAKLRDAQVAVMTGEGRVSLLNEHRAHPDLLHPDYARIIDGDRQTSPAQLLAAQNLGAACRVEFDGLAAAYDVILTPSATDEAPIGLENTGDPAFNQIWSILHTPCANLPLLRGPSGLPIGVTLTGPRLTDRKLLACARIIERAILPALSPLTV